MKKDLSITTQITYGKVQISQRSCRNYIFNKQVIARVSPAGPYPNQNGLCQLLQHSKEIYLCIDRHISDSCFDTLAHIICKLDFMRHRPIHGLCVKTLLIHGHISNRKIYFQQIFGNGIAKKEYIKPIKCAV